MQNLLWPILRRAMIQPRRTAIQDDQRTWRYLDLVGGALHLSKIIEQTSRTANVGVLLPTGGACPMVILAAWLARRTPVPINFLLADDERQYIVEHCQTDVVITARRLLDYLKWTPQKVKVLDLEDLSFRGLPPLR